MRSRVRFEARVVGQVQVDPKDHLSFTDEEVRDRDLSGARLVSLASVGSRFVGCRFERMRVRSVSLGAGMALSEYVDCSFDGSRMTTVLGGYARLVRCSFRSVDLRDWGTDHLEFIDCVFTGRIRSTVFWGSPPAGSQQRYEGQVRWLNQQGRAEPAGYRELALRSHNEFTGNDFSGADLLDVSFRRGIDLARQRLPTGDDYLYLPRARATLDRAVAELARCPDEDLRPRVVKFLTNVIARETDDGQEQLLLRESTFAKRGPRPHVTEAFKLLRLAAEAT